MRTANVIMGVAGALLLGACGGEEAPPAAKQQPTAAQQSAPSAPKPPSAVAQATESDRERLVAALADQRPKASAAQIDCLANGIVKQVGMTDFVEIVRAVKVSRKTDGVPDDPAAVAGLAEISQIEADCGIED